MQAELTAILSKVVFSKNGAQVVLECHSASSIDAARQVSKMTDKVVAATFDDGEEALPFDEEEQALMEEGYKEMAQPETIPFEEDETPNDFGDGCPFIDVPVEDDEDGAEVIEEVD